MAMRIALGFTALSLVIFSATAARAQAPRAAPYPDFVFHDERVVDRFTVQRWISRDMPDVSPAGFCECVTLVYEGTRLVLDLGIDAGSRTGRAVPDITGDGRAELSITNYTGGAHCCESTSIYSIDDAGVGPLLSVVTGHCPGQLVDLDRDGVPEFQTCDDVFAYEFCAFALSPMPPVVYAYDRTRMTFVVATPAFAKYLQLRTAEEARGAMGEAGSDPSLYRCAALWPALDLIYAGRLEDGWRLFRSLYQRPDRADIEGSVLELLKRSRHWLPQ